MLVTMPSYLSFLKQSNRQWHLDMTLLLPVLALMSIGFVMISSASFSFGDHRLGDELFFFKRHLVYLVLALITMAVTFLIPPGFWSRYSRLWMLFSFILLVLVLIPGIGRELNGSRRWLAVG